MEPWYKIATPRQEVRDGRSFDPNEFAIALEQVVSGKGPEDYRDPEKFFARTSFTRALREHTGMALRRLAGETQNTPPVLTLITQFGGGKTHTLTALYHLAKNGKKVAGDPDIQRLLAEAGLSKIPSAEVAVFVGNAWDPKPGRETPWIDVARQLAGDRGVDALGKQAKTTAPGTEAIAAVIEAAGGSTLFLFDEVLNFLNRHRDMADAFYAFVQNLTVALTGATKAAAVISLPRSQVEMTDWDTAWQEKISKVVRRVSKDLIVNDESEIGDVIRRRLFEDKGKEAAGKAAAKTYADWCFERRAQLPAEWTAVDTSATEAKARDFLRSRFEACFPFHPATLSVFQRKWQSLSQFQQTRGTLAMLAQWISWAYRDGYQRARREPLITLGSAPLDVSEFRAVILGQLGEPKLQAAIETDIAGQQSHARALDADTSGPLRDIHRRVGAAILFESSGGQGDKAAHLPELRFALGEPGLDTTSIDNAAVALERRGYYIRKAGADGYRFGFNPTLKKVVSDRRASLEDEEVRKATQTLAKKEFERGATLSVVVFPEDGTAVQDSTRLVLAVIEPSDEWSTDSAIRKTLAQWTKARGTSPRLYPGSILWCVRKPGRELRNNVELLLAWKRVERELADGSLGAEFDRSDRSEIATQVRDAEDAARDEIWASYRFVVLADRTTPDGIKEIDLGAGHSSASDTLCGRVLAALRARSLLNESPGAGYVERRWPEPFKETGAWPLSSLRQAFLTGAMERLVDVDTYLKSKVPEFVSRGDFGFASGQQSDGTYARVWFNEVVLADEVLFEAGVYLLTKQRAKALKAAPVTTPGATVTEPASEPAPGPAADLLPPTKPGEPLKRRVRITGNIPPELWNRLGTKLIPKVRAGEELRVGIDITVEVDRTSTLESDLRLILEDLDLADRVRVESS
ncbi:MAG: ATP-binding protein [Acidobacteria bacterium]|nr:ATP-binding protein [Acidobacteriota bacterium]